MSKHRLAVAAGVATASAIAASAHCRSAALASASDEELLTELKIRLSPRKMNTAFVFAKPHANTPAVLDVIEAKFAEKGITVLKEGIVTGEEIDSMGYIDQVCGFLLSVLFRGSPRPLPGSCEAHADLCP